MKIAIFTLTKNALKLAIKIEHMMENCDVYGKDWGEGDYIAYTNGFGNEVRAAFHHYDALVFIMATGIVVRTVAPYISSKLEDPAIVVLDEKGRNVISLLCGHLNGANALTLNLAELLHSNPVITTASDVNDTLSVDMVAKNNNFVLRDMEGAKHVTSLIVNGFRVAVSSDRKIKEKLPTNMFYLEDRDFYNCTLNSRGIRECYYKEDFDGIIFIDNKKIDIIDKPYVNLIPRNIIMGIGCKRGTSKVNILKAIRTLFMELNLQPDALRLIASIDLKSDEHGLIEAAKELDVPLLFYSKEDIAPVEHLFEGSEFVKQTVGVSSVSEACAYLAANEGHVDHFMVNKRKFEGITISILEEK